MDLKELLQTSSASRSVWCAGVFTAGRISYSVTRTPALRERPGRLRAGETAADHGGADGGAHASATSSGSASTTLLPHFMQVRVSPSALLIFFSIPTQPHSGQVSGTGLFQVEKSHAG